MLVTVKCDCGEIASKIDVDHAARQLRWSGDYGFGQHVTDPRAFVMRWLKIRLGWIYVGGRLGKNTLTMVCGKCRNKHASDLDDVDEAVEIQ